MIVLTTLRFRRDHRFTGGHLSDYVDGGLAVRAQGRIARHVPDCPECDEALRTLQQMLVLLHSLPAPTEPGRPDTIAADITAAVRRRLREPSAP